jgi:hypothetical protein
MKQIEIKLDSSQMELRMSQISKLIGELFKETKIILDTDEQEFIQNWLIRSGGAYQGDIYSMTVELLHLLQERHNENASDYLDSRYIRAVKKIYNIKNTTLTRKDTELLAHSVDSIDNELDSVTKALKKTYSNKINRGVDIDTRILGQKNKDELTEEEKFLLKNLSLINFAKNVNAYTDNKITVIELRNVVGSVNYLTRFLGENLAIEMEVRALLGNIIRLMLQKIAIISRLETNASEFSSELKRYKAYFEEKSKQIVL